MLVAVVPFWSHHQANFSQDAGRDLWPSRAGRAGTAIAPEGTDFAGGELWKAGSKTSISPGASVRVTGMDWLTLEIEAGSAAGVSNSASAQQ